MAERIYATDRKPRARCPELLGKRCSRPSLIGNAVSLERRNYGRVGDTGFEPGNQSPEKSVSFNQSASENASVMGCNASKTVADDPILAELIELWPSLDEATKTAILSLVRSSAGPEDGSVCHPDRVR